MKMWCLFLLALLPILAVGCGETKLAASEWSNVAEMKPWVNGLYDDGISTLYIQVDKIEVREADKAVAELIQKKKLWQEKNQDKEIAAMTMVTGDAGYNGLPAPFGLLIEYRIKLPQPKVYPEKPQGQQ